MFVALLFVCVGLHVSIHKFLEISDMFKSTWTNIRLGIHIFLSEEGISLNSHTLLLFRLNVFCEHIL